MILHRCLAWNERAAPDAPGRRPLVSAAVPGRGPARQPGRVRLPLSLRAAALVHRRAARALPRPAAHAGPASPARAAARARGARAARRRAARRSRRAGGAAPRAAASVAGRNPGRARITQPQALALHDEARRGRRAALVVDVRVAVAERDAVRPRRVGAAARLGARRSTSPARRSPRPPTSSAYASPEPTGSGKYGGASRKPMRASGPRWPRAIWSAAPMPPIGTKPSCRTAAASRAPAT